MKRLFDWRPRLSTEIARLMVTPFAWGTNDCALAMADCVAAMTGTDLAAEYRGKYSDRAGALAALNAAGYADLAAVPASQLEEIHHSRAILGDLAAMPAESEFKWALGIFAGERLGVLTPTGYGTISRPVGLRAFRIG